MTPVALSELFTGKISPRVPYGYATSVSTASRDAALAKASELYGLEPCLILNGGRDWKYSHPRQYAMWLLRQAVGPHGGPRYSLPAIARAVGLTDHTTVLYAVRVVEKRLAFGQIEHAMGIAA